MHPQSHPYFGIMTPLGELRVIARLGEGLVRQSEKLDSKVLKY